MKNKTLIMLIGKTHSGKTTFANKFKTKSDLLILEADPIAVFMKDKFPKLRKIDDTEHNGNFKNISLKFKVFLLFVEFGLSTGLPIMLSNSNMWSRGRKMIFKLCKKFKYKTIGVYFDYPEEVLIDRIKKTSRSTEALRLSKTFNKLIINQRSRMQEPKKKEFDEFFVVKKEGDLEKIIKDLKNKLK